MVLEVDEACILEPFENSVCGLLLGAWVTRKKRGKVDELLLLALHMPEMLGPHRNHEVVLRDRRIYSDVRHTASRVRGKVLEFSQLKMNTIHMQEAS